MNKMLTVADAAKELGVSSETIYRWTKDGQIRMVFISDRVRKVYQSDIDKKKLSMSVVKSCKDCGETDPESGFEPHRNICKYCYSVYQKDKRLRNADKLKAYEKKKYEKNKETIIARVNKWEEENKEERKEYRKNYYKENKPRISKENKKRQYNLTEEQYIDLTSSGNCDICGLADDKMCIDHDHDNGKVRGFLCNNCNSGLGFLQDRYEVVQKAYKYLQNYHNSLDDDQVNYSAYYNGAIRGVLPTLTSN